uniref:EOG090X0A5G n=1 Tax=Evadne anonyx TaxID=141404 RepID=A0A9N6WUX8_9CRUS|nr:EOG090X0A5G [Evadne anonyx]
MNNFFKFSVIVLLIGTFVAWYKPSQLEDINLTVSFQNVVKSYADVPYLKPVLKFLVNENQIEEPAGVPIKTEKVFTKQELSKFKGENGSPIYLALMGKIYDVSKGKDFYGPGGGYSFFTGLDGTRAFVSGDFTPTGLIEDISGLDNSEYLGILNWMEFYAKDYSYVGVVEGVYYNAEGKPTEYLLEAEKWIQAAINNKIVEDEFKQKYPMCNVDYKPEAGSTVWCSKSSGGVKRDWVGVPRTLHSAAGSNDIRCACVDEENLNDPLLKEYPNCAKDSVTCKLSN